MNPNEQTNNAPTPTPVQTTAPTAAAPGAGNNTLLMSILAYLGILVIIPLLVAKDDPVVKFHSKQGLVLCVGQVALWVASSMSYSMTVGMLAPVVMIANIALFVLAVIGIINAVKGEQKELPVVGSLAKHFPL